jgi:tetratricopeptide (TPR) repeat protein
MAIKLKPNNFIGVLVCLGMLSLALPLAYSTAASNLEVLRGIKAYYSGCKACPIHIEMIRAESQYTAGRLYYLSGDAVRGQAVLAQQNSASSRAIFVHLTLADNLFNQGDETGAIQEWKAAGAASFLLQRARVGADQSQVFAWSRLASMVDPSVQVVDQALELIKVVKDPSKMKDFYKSVAQAGGPEGAMGQRMLGQLAMAGWKNKDAVVYLENSVKLNPQDASAWYNLGRAAQNAEIYPKAEQAYLQMLQVDPNNPKAYGALGSLYEKTGSTEQAIAAYEKATALGGYWHFWDRLAALYTATGMPSRAQSVCQQALKLWPDQKLDCEEQ